MFPVESIVWGVLFLLGVGAIWGLLFYLVGYCESQFPSTNGIFYKAARILLVIAAVLVLIGMILQALGHPLISFDRRL